MFQILNLLNSGFSRSFLWLLIFLPLPGDLSASLCHRPFHHIENLGGIWFSCLSAFLKSRAPHIVVIQFETHCREETNKLTNNLSRAATASTCIS